MGLAAAILIHILYLIILFQGAFIQGTPLIGNSYMITMIFVQLYFCDHKTDKQKSTFKEWAKSDLSVLLPVMAGAILIGLVTMLSKASSWAGIAPVAGCMVLLPMFSFVYYLLDVLIKNNRAVLLMCFLLGILASAEILLALDAVTGVHYDIFSLFSDYHSFMNFESGLWLIRTAVIVCLLGVINYTLKRE